MISNTTRATSLYPPPTVQTKPYISQSETTNYPTTKITNDPSSSSTGTGSNPVLRSLSPEDVQKLKYKIDLDRQVAEKQQRLTREWQKKIERDKKYVQHQAFGRHDRTTVLRPQELEEIIIKGRAPSPVLDTPQQYPLLHQPNSQQQQSVTLPPATTRTALSPKQQSFKSTDPYMSNENTPTNMFAPPRPAPMNSYSQYPSFSTAQTQQAPPPPPPPPATMNNYSNNSNPNTNNNNGVDFQRFYGPTSNASSTASISLGSSTTAQPLKGDAHDPFSLYDPNKEGQNVFNTIPQQDLYDPWGRPGGGAPLVHAPTGQKFTRYSGSLQDKLNATGPLGFHRRQYTGDINEQKRELELEQRRRQQDDLEFRSNAGNTAEWITQLEGNRYPLRLHLPTTETTREITGARTRFRSDESRQLHEDLVQQAEERARLQKMSRFHENIAEMHHSEAMNNWWGKGGGGAPAFTNRRHNVHQSFEHPRSKWTTNHLGQLTMAEDEGGSVKVQATDFYYPKSKQLSNHRNYYQVADDQAS